MKVVLLSGGSGKRLWPLSNDTRSKQFLKVLRDEQGHLESMIQRVWRQIGRAGLGGDAFISTGKGQSDLICSQLGEDVPLIVEPSRRDTFPAIALACAYLYSAGQTGRDEVVVVQPVDPYVDDSFFTGFAGLEELLRERTLDLALIGVKPTIPSEKYGYIVPAADTQLVERFVEKPDTYTAEQLIRDHGALWNCGVFAFKLDLILNWLERHELPLDYDLLAARYEELEKTSFDYKIVEKLTKIGVLRYEGFWKDLGTWNTLTEEMGTAIMGKGVLSSDSSNTQILNELDIPVSVLGIKNAVVVVSPDGILVSDKFESTKIKQVVDQWGQRPMYEERRWGWYRVLDYTKKDDHTEVLTKRIGVHQSHNLSYQTHQYRNEVWTVISGEGLMLMDKQLFTIRPGDVIHIRSGVPHAVKALTDLEIIEVQMGCPLIEEDIRRIYMTWDEMMENRG
ncbi:mannose-1-phosphate guanylyltransferase [Paenibacillus sambharensis]|uniref:Mannose-1-phosphate guanylyltransferase n=1 Tax=Paenibacillus sambharensis TaxID=1803190 RepID=A0A2W1LTJ3_9BACL|nr:sugar phosphate nucleotidyltransferase [Paenibacillus sambharensis]PZD94767.1 mannose-1-phosphate guanylyltransferase [Paenibacillus sambharensis]